MKSDNEANPGTQGEFVGAADAQAIVDQRIYRKTLTMATIGAAPERAKTQQRVVLLCRIAGEVRGTARECSAEEMKKPEDQREYFTALVGQFEADVYDDNGEVVSYAGGQCYLPTGFHEAVLTELTRAIEANGDSGFARFNLEFAASDKTKAPAGYSYMARNLNRVRVDPNDALAIMRREGEDVRKSDQLPWLGGAGPDKVIGYQRAK